MSFATRIRNISDFYLLNNKNKFSNFSSVERYDDFEKRSMDNNCKKRNIETVKIFPMFLHILKSSLDCISSLIFD